MLKLVVVLIALVAVALADDAQLNNQNIINSRAEDIAKWATSRLNQFTKLSGDHKFVKVSNVKTELLQDKIKFDLYVDVAIGDANNGAVKSCHIIVMDSPWTNSRILDDKISCVDSATF